MISDLKLLNYNEKLYNIFKEGKTLYINFYGKTKIISDDVLDYCLEYFDKSLWISTYNNKNLIYLYEIRIEEYGSIKINTHFVLDIRRYSQKIDSLTMIIKNENQINLIFRGWNNNKSFIFNSNISICSDFNIISDNTLNNKTRPFSTYSEDDKAMILISEQGDCEEYVLYNLIEDTAEESFLLPNTSNISIVKYKNKPILFYNKEIDSNLYIKYRYVDIGKEGESIYDEKSLSNISDNILNPKVSVYMGMIYLVWKNNNYIKSAISRDLSNWNINYSEKTINCVNTNIIKVLDDKIEKINTYMKKSIVYNLVINRDNYRIRDNNYKLLELLFYENSLNSKFDNINNLMKIQEYYNKRNEEYIIKIRELNNIITEKDKLIYKLLNTL
ncbi:hypothetical protein [Clostridium sp. D53t1_180928_C8]|uniref:hypothetical protein n=1 Tax=Clostridium sp. D53t1_180928_C8 TaxID=2787101 RepID=UPI0018AC0C82|nr:hypothetical protein [Clostridium sp. D53t1_180928_C8]